MLIIIKILCRFQIKKQVYLHLVIRVIGDTSLGKSFQYEYLKGLFCTRGL